MNISANFDDFQNCKCQRLNFTKLFIYMETGLNDICLTAMVSTVQNLSSDIKKNFLVNMREATRSRAN